MERLISLFREPDDESWSLSNGPTGAPQPPPRAQEEPLYFKQLLDFLQERKAKASEPSDELIEV